MYYAQTGSHPGDRRPQWTIGGDTGQVPLGARLTIAEAAYFDFALALLNNVDLSPNHARQRCLADHPDLPSRIPAPPSSHSNGIAIFFPRPAPDPKL